MPNLRYVGRALMRARWFTAAAVLSFAVGFGVNLAAFATLDRVLFRSLPYHDPHRLVLLRVCDQNGTCGGAFPSAVAFEGRTRLTSIQGFAATGFARSGTFSREQTGEPPVRLTEASHTLLSVLGVRPVIGRDFSEEDERLKRGVALVSFESWRRRFGGSAAVLGQELWSDNRPITVVGVLPEGFIVPSWAAPDPAWDGLVLDLSGFAAIKPSGSILAPVARLAPGATIDTARAEIAALATALQTSAGRAGEAPPRVAVDSLQSTLFSRFRPYFWLIAAATTILLLLACANLATLLLARGRSRAREVAIASALGASRARVIAEALAESLLVCVAGAATAVGVLWVTEQSLAAVVPPMIGRYASAATEPRVLIVALSAAFACALAAGALPALRVARVDLLRVLQSSSSRTSGRGLRGSASLIAVQTALGVVLVLSALLVLRSFRTLQRDDLGFNPDRLYTLTAAPAARLPAPAALETYKQLLGVLGEIPGVSAVGGADVPVGIRAAAFRSLAKEPAIVGERFEISAGYLETLESRFLAGRPFTKAEVAARAPLAILSVSGLRAVWPDVAPPQGVGRFLTLDNETRRVIGIVGDLKRRYGGEAQPAIFVPLGAGPTYYSAAVLRTEPGVVPDFVGLRQRIEQRLGPRRLALTHVATTFDSALQDPRFRAVLFTLLAAAALLLSAVGLYAVASFDVRRREYEMGVRLSLGATARDINRLVLLQASRPVLMGLALGFTGAYWASQFLQQFLYQAQARDPWMFVPVAGLLLGAALLATWLPARRAASVDPATVLRAQ